MNGPLLELNLTQPVAASCPTAESIHNDGLSLFPDFKPDPFARSRYSKKREKICSKCKLLLPINQFQKRSLKKTGRFKVCHDCFHKLQHKTCSRCKISLHFDNFPKISSGRSTVCTLCSKTRGHNDPNPAIRCAQCLYDLGFGYHRISIQIFGKISNATKSRIADWKRQHHWNSSSISRNKSYYAALRYKNPKPPKPTKPPRDLIYLKNHKRRRVYLRKKVWIFLKHAQHLESTAELIGCNRAQFIAYLTPLLQPGMTFQNYGPIWHIDHKIPCKFFDLSKPDQRSLCFHYTNLQPMFAHENKVKWATLPSADTLHGNLTTLKALALAAQREFPFQ